MVKRLFYYKGRVTPEYKHLLLYSGMLSTLTSCEYAISTHCILNALTDSGGGSMTANFLSKDMMGQMGGLLLLSRLKRWSAGSMVLSSCLFIQAGVGCDVMVMVIPEYLIPLSVTSTILKNVSFTLISAVNIRVLNHVVPKESLGEAYIGFNALSTITSSLGMAVGLGLIQGGVWLPVVAVSGVFRYVLLKKLKGLEGMDKGK